MTIEWKPGTGLPPPEGQQVFPGVRVIHRQWPAVRPLFQTFQWSPGQAAIVDSHRDERAPVSFGADPTPPATPLPCSSAMQGSWRSPATLKTGRSTRVPHC
jgi:hypothetical protein